MMIDPEKPSIFFDHPVAHAFSRVRTPIGKGIAIAATGIGLLAAGVVSVGLLALPVAGVIAGGIYGFGAAAASGLMVQAGAALGVGALWGGLAALPAIITHKMWGQDKMGALGVPIVVYAGTDMAMKAVLSPLRLIDVALSFNSKAKRLPKTQSPAQNVQPPRDKKLG